MLVGCAEHDNKRRQNIIFFYLSFRDFIEVRIWWDHSAQAILTCNHIYQNHFLFEEISWNSLCWQITMYKLSSHWIPCENQQLFERGSLLSCSPILRFKYENIIQSFTSVCDTSPCSHTNKYICVKPCEEKKEALSIININAELYCELLILQMPFGITEIMFKFWFHVYLMINISQTLFLEQSNWKYTFI